MSADALQNRRLSLRWFDPTPATDYPPQYQQVSAVIRNLVPVSTASRSERSASRSLSQGNCVRAAFSLPARPFPTDQICVRDQDGEQQGPSPCAALFAIRVCHAWRGVQRASGTAGNMTSKDRRPRRLGARRPVIAQDPLSPFVGDDQRVPVDHRQPRRGSTRHRAGTALGGRNFRDPRHRGSWRWASSPPTCPTAPRSTSLP
jgi:hypothetical protein